ncbi:hypothetical protein [Paenibacillus sonchi]|uniref:hypothetical protein n=1 Tax=Paenibacillus sonchi TaxID=373687 RepID=UPI001E33C9DD|nr:hypothetical protein [Paenibacillus sonchi]MCE3202491.1 hypothetical protein [Paenibacillus sonchi]
MGYDYYISPDDYARAEANGIKRKTVEARIWVLGWEKGRAITLPPKRQYSRKKWLPIAQQNGIPERIFYNRVCKGWLPERAATQPLLTQAEKTAKMKANNPAKRVYPQALIDQAAAYGISRNTFQKRVESGWDWERAASEPLISLQERGRRGVQTLRQQRGDINALIFNERVVPNDGSSD